MRWKENWLRSDVREAPSDPTHIHLLSEHPITRQQHHQHTHRTLVRSDAALPTQFRHLRLVYRARQGISCLLEFRGSLRTGWYRSKTKKFGPAWNRTNPERRRRRGMSLLLLRPLLGRSRCRHRRPMAYIVFNFEGNISIDTHQHPISLRNDGVSVVGLRLISRPTNTNPTLPVQPSQNSTRRSPYFSSCAPSFPVQLSLHFSRPRLDPQPTS